MIDGGGREREEIEGEGEGERRAKMKPLNDKSCLDPVKNFCQWKGGKFHHHLACLIFFLNFFLGGSSVPLEWCGGVIFGLHWKQKARSSYQRIQADATNCVHQDI